MSQSPTYKPNSGSRFPVRSPGRPKKSSVYSHPQIDDDQKLYYNLQECQKNNVNFTQRHALFYTGLLLFLFYPTAMVGLAYLALNKLLNHSLFANLTAHTMITIKIFIGTLLLGYFVCICALYANSMMRFLRKKSQRVKSIFKLYQNVDRAYSFCHKTYPEGDDTPEKTDRFLRSRSNPYQLFMESANAEVMEHLWYNAAKAFTLHKKQQSFVDYCDKLKKQLKKAAPKTYASILTTLNPTAPKHEKKFKDSWEQFNNEIAAPSFALLREEQPQKNAKHQLFLGLVAYAKALSENRLEAHIASLDSSNLVDKILINQYHILDKPHLDALTPISEQAAQDAKKLVLLRIKLRAWRWVKLFLWQNPFWPSIIGFLSKYINPLINGIICFFSAKTLLGTLLHWHNPIGVTCIALICFAVGFACSHFTTAKACIKRFCRAQRWYHLSKYWQENKVQPYMRFCLFIAGLMAVGSTVISYFAISNLLLKITAINMSAVAIGILSGSFALLGGICAFSLYLGSALKLFGKKSITATIQGMLTNSSFWLIALPGALVQSTIVYFTLQSLFPIHNLGFYACTLPVVLCAFLTLTLVYTQESSCFPEELAATALTKPLQELDDKAYAHMQTEQTLTPTPEALREIEQQKKPALVIRKA